MQRMQEEEDQARNTQIMAPLPKVRLRFTYRPFDQSAVDYAGPFIRFKVEGDSDKSDGYVCSRVLRRELSIWK